VLAVFFLVILSSLPNLIILGSNNEFPPSAVRVFLATHGLEDLFRMSVSMYGNELAEHLIMLLVLGASSIWLIRRVRHFALICGTLTTVLILFHPLTMRAITKAKVHDHQKRLGVSEHFSPPVLAVRPDRKKNVVLLYLESLERTFGKIEPTRDAFGEIAELELLGVSATNVSEIDGSSFSVAGLVATHCGVPFFFLPDETARTPDQFAESNGFMPGVTCLSDLLKGEGYSTNFMVGAGLAQFALKPFVQSHGYEYIFGNNSVPSWMHKHSRNPFGLDDGALFQYVYSRLKFLSENDRPFLLTIRTTTLHAPGAMPSSDCAPDANPFSQGIRCTAKRIRQLLDKLEELRILKDTVVVVMNDHLVMANPFNRELDKTVGGRRNLFFVLNSDSSPSTVLTRPATSLDLYPTILNVLGYSLENGEANLGVSLFSDKPTLIETYGLETINLGLSSNPELIPLLDSGS